MRVNAIASCPMDVDFGGRPLTPDARLSCAHRFEVSLAVRSSFSQPVQYPCFLRFRPLHDENSVITDPGQVVIEVHLVRTELSVQDVSPVNRQSCQR